MSGSITQVRPTVAYDFETLVVSNSAVGLTQSKYRPDSGPQDNATKAFLTLEGGQIRYTFHGSNPTTTVGHVLDAGGFLVAEGQHQMEKLKLIRTGSTDGTFSISYERE